MPVINGLTDLLHPCQVLADLQTVVQRFGADDVGHTLRTMKYAWIGDGNNMANSWIEAAGILGLDLALACPAGLRTRRGRAVAARARPSAGGSRSCASRPPRSPGRNVISTDVWASMGQEAEADARRQAFAGFCVDGALMRGAAPDAIVLHCLPAHRGEEITDEVIEGPASAGLAAGGEPAARAEGAARVVAALAAPATRRAATAWSGRCRR